MSLEAKIEAILFFKNQAMSLTKLAEITESSKEEVEEALTQLETMFTGRGICLVRDTKNVSLATAPGASELITSLQKDELSADIGKAGLETLSIILYKGPVAKRDIDYIRGVNSSYIIRNLLVRGLVERDSSTGAQGFVYKPTLELLQYLGIARIEDLPEYEKNNETLDGFQESVESASKQNTE